MWFSRFARKKLPFYVKYTASDGRAHSINSTIPQIMTMQKFELNFQVSELKSQQS